MNYRENKILITIKLILSNDLNKQFITYTLNAICDALYSEHHIINKSDIKMLQRSTLMIIVQIVKQ